MTSLNMIARTCFRRGMMASFYLPRASTTILSHNIILKKHPFLSVTYSTTPPPPQQSSNDNSSTTPTNTTEGVSSNKVSRSEDLKAKTGKLRTFIRKYGPIGIITYFGMYGVTLAGVYGLVSSGILMAADAISLFKAIHLDKFIDLDSLDPRASNFAVAWILTKFTEPLRFALTIAITPSIYRFITGRRSARKEEDEDEEEEREEREEKEKERKEKKDKKDRDD